MEGRKDGASIIRYDLCGKVAVRTFQLLEGRDVGKYPHYGYESCCEQYRNREQYPEPFDYFLSCSVCHILIASFF